MRRPAPTTSSRRRALVVVLAVSVAPAAVRAETAPAASTAPPPSSDATAASSAADRDASQGAAALRAAQDLEVQVIELRRELDAQERARAATDDLRRRLDDLEARQAARASSDAWTSWPASRDGDSLRFSQNGYTVRSPDNRFLLRPGLRLQTIYVGQRADAGFDDAGARPDSSAFTLAHAELLLDGHAVSPRFEYRLELDFADATTGAVKDAFVQWRLARSIAVRVGHVLVPYGLQTQTWNAYLEQVDVAAATSAFTLDRDVGLMVVGRPLAGRLEYELAALDGPRAPCPDNADGLRCDVVDLAYAARLVAAPLGPLPIWEGDVEPHAQPLFAVGVSGAYQLLPTDVRARTGIVTAPLDLDRNNLVDNVGVWLVAAEARAVFRGAAVQGEWFGRREHPGAGASDRDYWGAYGEASYFVLPRRLQIVARLGRTDLPLYGAALAERAARGTRTTEEGGGVSAYLRGHDAKLQVDYTHLATPDALSAPEVHRVRAAVQLAF
jgi:phosphate-selective porin OprO and OprP